MQNLSDTGLMLALFLFLAIFYICVALFYVKTKIPKAATNTLGDVQTRHIFSQVEYSTPNDNFYRNTPGDNEKTVVQATQAPQSTKADSKTESSLPSQQTQTKGDEGLSLKGGTDDTREIVEAMKGSVKDTETTKEAEKVDTLSLEQNKISDDWDRSEHHVVSEDFVKSLKDLKDAIDELMRRINRDVVS